MNCPRLMIAVRRRSHRGRRPVGPCAIPETEPDPGPGRRGRGESAGSGVAGRGGAGGSPAGDGRVRRVSGGGRRERVDGNRGRGGWRSGRGRRCRRAPTLAPSSGGPGGAGGSVSGAAGRGGVDGGAGAAAAAARMAGRGGNAAAGSGGSRRSRRQRGGGQRWQRWQRPGSGGSLAGRGGDGGGRAGAMAGRGGSGGTAGSGAAGAGGSTTCSVSPVNPNATPQARKLLCYLYSLYGKNVLSGQQETSWSNPANDVNWYNTNVGKYPAILGGDYLYPSGTTSRAQAYWNAGGITMIRYHMGAPPSVGHVRELDGHRQHRQRAHQRDDGQQLVPLQAGLHRGRAADARERERRGAVGAVPRIPAGRLVLVEQGDGQSVHPALAIHVQLPDHDQRA